MLDQADNEYINEEDRYETEVNNHSYHLWRDCSLLRKDVDTSIYRSTL